MNLQQKNFIREKLIPFVLREQGRGFAMSQWLGDYIPFTKGKFDGVRRKIPACGTVACLGGSIEALSMKIDKVTTEVESGNYDNDEMARKIGLTPRQGHTLFFGWRGSKYMDKFYDEEPVEAWPAKYILSFKNAKTPFTKAKVAVALLEEVVKTNGKILDPK